ncbi:hypothetical protein DUI87_04852 [Hirundo rustica rustica]|uniref:P/Homo B domain-containing protein n=1 Tax=Hirundo rustica rustica TaxID=333673 RepID=A0A3M0KXK5_HIRRU|nr:hypothetical protein DUI87_04852 [Hirundo rustica rustica]
MDSAIKYTLINFTDNMKQCGTVNTLERRDAIQRTLKGLRVSHLYGFGLMDAEAMVTEAENGQRCLHSITIRPDSIVRSIYKATGCSDNPNHHVIYLEHVVVRITITHPRRGDLAIYLTSPSGTRSQLLANRLFDHSMEGFKNWEFMTTHCWSEKAAGDWVLEICDTPSQLRNFKTPGKLKEWSLVLYGTSIQPYSPRNDFSKVERVRSSPVEDPTEDYTTDDYSGPCNAECSKVGCDGPGPDHCTDCLHYYYKSKTTQGAGVDACINCTQGYFMEDGRCVQSCSSGYYLDHSTESRYKSCKRCDPSCLDCSGQGERNCTSCPNGYNLDTGVCVMGTVCKDEVFIVETRNQGTFQAREDHQCKCIEETEQGNILMILKNASCVKYPVRNALDLSQTTASAAHSQGISSIAINTVQKIPTEMKVLGSVKTVLATVLAVTRKDVTHVWKAFISQGGVGQMPSDNGPAIKTSLGQCNPSFLYRLRNKRLKRSVVEMDHGALIDGKLNTEPVLKHAQMDIMLTAWRGDVLHATAPVTLALENTAHSAFPANWVDNSTPTQRSKTTFFVIICILLLLVIGAIVFIWRKARTKIQPVNKGRYEKLTNHSSVSNYHKNPSYNEDQVIEYRDRDYEDDDDEDDIVYMGKDGTIYHKFKYGLLEDDEEDELEYDDESYSFR